MATTMALRTVDNERKKLFTVRILEVSEASTCVRETARILGP